MAVFFLLITIAIGILVGQGKIVTPAEKQDFIALVKKLPTRGEFFTDEAVKKAGQYLRVLFALNEKDIGKDDIYAYVALSGGLCDSNKENRDYAVKHFNRIGHPLIQMQWGVMLFNLDLASPEIVTYLLTALESNERSNQLLTMLGPDFDRFKKRLHDKKPKNK
jgi:hypothetical protein